MNLILVTTTSQRRNGGFAEGAGAVGHYPGEGDLGSAQFRVDGAHTLEDEITSGTKELGEAKAAKAESETANAAAEGDLAVAARPLQWTLRPWPIGARTALSKAAQFP